MAKDTVKTYRNQIMYSVFVRAHSAEGSFEGVRGDLERIKGLGTDIIWLMPIHPIGKANRKGSLGCPYAVMDYRKVNPEYGTIEDFQRLVDDIHRLGMKCIIDVVYNHTSPDSWLALNHPEWFYHKPDGSFGNHIGDWTDVIDLDYSHRELWDYQIETLKYWAGMVDGFRCDVASLVPLDFWLKARKEVEKVRPHCLWLAESVEPVFIAYTRANGIPTCSDSEMYRAFDVCYDYDIFPCFKEYLSGEASLSQYAQEVNRQEYTYPYNYVKLRFLENHDNSRAAFIIPDASALENWTAFNYFQKGMTLIYGGQERSCAHLPSLFDRDPVDWTGPDLTPLMQRLAEIKRSPLLTDSTYSVTSLPGDILYASHRKAGRQLIGIFSLRGSWGLISTDAPDGEYTNLIDGSPLEVKAGRISCNGRPIIFEAPAGEMSLGDLS